MSNIVYLGYLKYVILDKLECFFNLFIYFKICIYCHSVRMRNGIGGFVGFVFLLHFITLQLKLHITSTSTPFRKLFICIEEKREEHFSDSKVMEDDSNNHLQSYKNKK